MAKKTKKQDPWLDVLDEGGRPEVIEHMPQKGWTKFLKPYMWVAVLTLPLLLFGSIFTISNMSSEIQAMRTTIANQRLDASSPGRAVATETVRKWLAQTPSPLPGGYIVSWDGSQNIPLTTRTNENNQDMTEVANFTSEVNNFTVADDNNQLWNVSVLVKIDNRDQSAKAMGGPSVSFKLPAADDGWDKGSIWPGIAPDPKSVTDNGRTAIQTWADAYGSGDPKKLTVSVGDPDGNHTYVPLYNVSSIKATVGDAAPLVYGDPSKVIANVTLDILWQGQTKPDSDSRTIPTTMDVLIDRANTASPVVVAWGPSGTGPTLTTYVNAIATRVVEAPPTVKPTVSPSATPTASSSPSASPTQQATTQPTQQATTSTTPTAEETP